MSAPAIAISICPPPAAIRRPLRADPQQRQQQSAQRLSRPALASRAHRRRQGRCTFSSPPKQLLWPQPVLPRHFGDNGAWLLAFQHDARLGFRRPTASSADTRDHFDALQTFRNALSALKRMLVRISKSMLAHGQALWPCQIRPGRWEETTAYTQGNRSGEAQAVRARQANPLPTERPPARFP